MRTRRLPLRLTLVLAALTVAPVGLAAQQTEADSLRARTDSLEARILELEARLDSLLAALARGQATDSAARGAAANLEALRALARAAAGGEQPQDTAGQAGRTRNLNVLNPEISATGDVVGTFIAPAGEDNEFSALPREFEFSFQSALDPYTRTKIFVTYEQELEIAGSPIAEDDAGGIELGHGAGSVAIEEGYLYWVGLPARLGLKAGVFRQEIGLYNRWHNHALREVDRPLPSVAFLGDDGLIQTGAALTLPTLSTGAGTHSGTLELTRAENEALFAGSNEISFLGNVRSFWDLSPSSYLQLGVSGVYGENDGESLVSRLLQLDISYRWRPPGRALYRDFSFKGEWYFARQDFGPSELTGDGGYLQASLRLNRRWIAGLRADYLNYYGDDPEVYQLVPSLTWWQSEWVYLRLQYNYLKWEGADGNHTVLLQTVWAMGPHKHETY